MGSVRSPSAISAPLPVQLTCRQLKPRRDPTLQSRERDRVAMYLLSVDGITATLHFGCGEATLRRWIHSFEASGLKVR